MIRSARSNLGVGGGTSNVFCSTAGIRLLFARRVSQSSSWRNASAIFNLTDGPVEVPAFIGQEWFAGRCNRVEGHVERRPSRKACGGGGRPLRQSTRALTPALSRSVSHAAESTGVGAEVEAKRDPLTRRSSEHAPAAAVRDRLSHKARKEGRANDARLGQECETGVWPGCPEALGGGRSPPAGTRLRVILMNPRRCRKAITLIRDMPSIASAGIWRSRGHSTGLGEFGQPCLGAWLIGTVQARRIPLSKAPQIVMRLGTCAGSPAE